jgi:hypothetical protein
LESVDSSDDEEEHDANEENDSLEDEISNSQQPFTDLQLDFLTEPRSTFSSLAPSPVSAPAAVSGSGSAPPPVTVTATKAKSTKDIAPIQPKLLQLTQEAGNAAKKLGGKAMNAGASKRGRDFSTSYHEVKSNELDFKRQCYLDERADKRRAEDRVDADRRNAFLLKLIEMGKSDEEIEVLMNRFS